MFAGWTRTQASVIKRASAAPVGDLLSWLLLTWGLFREEQGPFKPLSAIVLFQLHTWLLHIIPVDALTTGLTFVGVIKDFVSCKLFSRFQCNVHVEPLRVEAEYLTVVWLKHLVLVILTMFLRNSHKCFYAVLFYSI